MSKKTYIVKIEEEKLKSIKEFISKLRLGSHNEEFHQKMNDFFNSFEPRKTSKKVKQATDTATAKRTAQAKEKIQNAVNILRMENKKITHYAIARTAKVSYNTVKKYLPDVESFVDRQLRAGAKQE